VEPAVGHEDAVEGLLDERAELGLEPDQAPAPLDGDRGEPLIVQALELGASDGRRLGCEAW